MTENNTIICRIVVTVRQKSRVGRRARRPPNAGVEQSARPTSDAGITSRRRRRRRRRRVGA